MRSGDQRWHRPRHGRGRTSTVQQDIYIQAHSKMASCDRDVRLFASLKGRRQDQGVMIDACAHAIPHRLRAWWPATSVL